MISLLTSADSISWLSRTEVNFGCMATDLQWLPYPILALNWPIPRIASPTLWSGKDVVRHCHPAY